MTPSPFQIKKPLGRSYRVDFDDTVRAKQALLRLGYFKTPRYGLTQYPDEPLFSAIEEFQDANGLYRDGIMRPEGETATHLGRALADIDQQQLTQPRRQEDELTVPPHPRGQASKILSQPSVFGLLRVLIEGTDNDPRDITATQRALAWAGYYPTDGARPNLFEAIKRFQADHGLEVDGVMRPQGPTARTLDETIAPKVIDHLEKHPEAIEQPDEEIQVAQAGLVRSAIDLAKRFAPPAIGMLSDLMKRRPSDNEVPPTPSGSPTEPPEFEPKEEILPVEQEIPIFRGQPITEALKTNPAVFEIVSDALGEVIVVESHRGDDDTKEGNIRTAELCKEEFEEGWGSESGRIFEHVAGAEKKNDEGRCQYLKERYIENPQTGRLNSSNADVSWQFRQIPGDPKPDHIPDWNDTVDHEMQRNTGRTRQDGKPIAYEARQLSRMIQNAAKRQGLGDFFTKLRPGVDEKKWEEQVRKECRDMLKRIFGNPPKRPEN